MQKRVRICLGVSISWLAFAWAGPISADPQIDAEYAGSSRTTPVDADMMFTAENRVGGSGRFGAFVLEGLETWVWDFTQTCPRAGDLPIRLVEGGSVATYGTSGQLMLEAQSGLICLEVFTSRFHGRQSGTIIGGTGRFDGAHGSYVTEFEGEDVVPDLSRLSGTLSVQIDR